MYIDYEDKNHFFHSIPTSSLGLYRDIQLLVLLMFIETSV